MLHCFTLSSATNLYLEQIGSEEMNKAVWRDSKMSASKKRVIIGTAFILCASLITFFAIQAHLSRAMDDRILEQYIREHVFEYGRGHLGNFDVIGTKLYRSHSLPSWVDSEVVSIPARVCRQ